MADDADSGTEEAADVESGDSGDGELDAIRAAFIAGDLSDSDDGDADDAAPKAKSNAKPAVEADDDDDDDDLDDEDAESTADDADDADEDEEVEPVAETASDDEDPDADLDDDKPAKPADDDQAKRLEAVRKTDRRLREQRERHFAERERKIEEREAGIKSRLEAAERFEKLKERGFVHALESLAAEANEEDIELGFKRLFAMSKAGKADPKWKAAVDAMQKEREVADKLKSVEKQLADEKAERERAAREAEGRKNAEAFVEKAAGMVVGKKAALGEKTTLVKHLLETDPDGARGDMFIVANRLANELGRLPEHKEVVVAFEKQERARLRRYGIDPKTLKPTGKASATTDEKSKTKTVPKPGEKTLAKNGKAAKPATDDDDAPLTKEDFIRGSKTKN